MTDNAVPPDDGGVPPASDAVPPDDGSAPRDWGFAPPGGTLEPPAPPYGQQLVPGPASGAATAGPGGWPPVAAAPTPRWRRSPNLLVGVVVLTLVLVLALVTVIAGPGARTISLPSTLLGLSHGTGPAAQAAAQGFARVATAASHGTVTDVVARVYGDPTGRWLAVVVGKPCSSCFIYPASHDVSVAKAHGHADARSFPPGPQGGVLVCYSDVSQAPDPIVCSWFSTSTIGIVDFASGTASNLADAAAKAIRIRAAVKQ
jgi:hypothetical protein